MSEFKFIPKEFEKGIFEDAKEKIKQREKELGRGKRYITISEVISLEIAHQLRRIADIVTGQRKK